MSDAQEGQVFTKADLALARCEVLMNYWQLRMVGVMNTGTLGVETYGQLEETILELQEDFSDWWLFRAIDLLAAEQDAIYLSRDLIDSRTDEERQTHLAAAVMRFRGICALLARRDSAVNYSSILERWVEAKGPR